MERIEVTAEYNCTHMHVCMSECTNDYTDSAVTLAHHILHLLVSLLHSLSTRLYLKLDILNYCLFVASLMLFRVSNRNKNNKIKLWIIPQLFKSWIKVRNNLIFATFDNLLLLLAAHVSVSVMDSTYSIIDNFNHHLWWRMT